MSKQNKAQKRKAKVKAKKQQAIHNQQSLTERLSVALEKLCEPVLPEYIDDSRGPDLTGRNIVWQMGMIAWNIHVTGRQELADCAAPDPDIVAGTVPARRLITGGFCFWTFTDADLYREFAGGFCRDGQGDTGYFLQMQLQFFRGEAYLRMGFFVYDYFRAGDSVADDFHTSAAQCREQQKQNAVDHKLSATPYFCDRGNFKSF